LQNIQIKVAPLFPLIQCLDQFNSYPMKKTILFPVALLFATTTLWAQSGILQSPADTVSFKENVHKVIVY
jgi:hypothetical protein